MNFLDVLDYEYECVSGFDRASNIPPNSVDERCFTPEYVVSPNSSQCGGDPYHADFWHYNVENDYFTKRHKVLFNLYAFDAMRTRNVKPPALELVGCTFKFFVNQHDALIQVETNNLGYMGSVDEEGVDNRIITYYGEDRGARITVENSNFYSNSFCKGLIYYNRF